MQLPCGLGAAINALCKLLIHWLRACKAPRALLRLIIAREIGLGPVGLPEQRAVATIQKLVRPLLGAMDRPRWPSTCPGGGQGSGPISGLAGGKLCGACEPQPKLQPGVPKLNLHNGKRCKPFQSAKVKDCRYLKGRNSVSWNTT